LQLLEIFLTGNVTENLKPIYVLDVPSQLQSDRSECFRAKLLRIGAMDELLTPKTPLSLENKESFHNLTSLTWKEDENVA
jgi:hypothetical protein